MPTSHPPLADPRVSLARRAYALEAATLGWNVVGTAVLVAAAASASSVALAAFALDSLLEIGASGVVMWELAGRDGARRARALRLIGAAFGLLALYLLVQSTLALAGGHRAAHSPVGIAWTGATALVMFALAAGKRHVGRALANPVVLAEGRVTVIDGALASAVLAGLVANAAVGWWWADSAAGLVIALYAAREAQALLGEGAAA